MSHRTDQLTARQLIEMILACDSQDEIHAIASGWIRASPRTGARDQSGADAESRKCLGALLVSMCREADFSDAEVDAMSDRNQVFLLAARTRTSPSSSNPVAIYFSRNSTEAWIAGQDPVLREALEIYPWRLDEHPGDDVLGNSAVIIGNKLG